MTQVKRSVVSGYPYLPTFWLPLRAWSFSSGWREYSNSFSLMYTLSLGSRCKSQMTPPSVILSLVRWEAHIIGICSSNPHCDHPHPNPAAAVRQATTTVVMHDVRDRIRALYYGSCTVPTRNRSWPDWPSIEQREGETYPPTTQASYANSARTVPSSATCVCKDNAMQRWYSSMCLCWC